MNENVTYYKLDTNSYAMCVRGASSFLNHGIQVDLQGIRTFEGWDLRHYTKVPEEEFLKRFDETTKKLISLLRDAL